MENLKPVVVVWFSSKKGGDFCEKALSESEGASTFVEAVLSKNEGASTFIDAVLFMCEST